MGERRRLDPSEEHLLQQLVTSCRASGETSTDAELLLDLVALEVELARSGRTDGSAIWPTFGRAVELFRESGRPPWLFGGAAHLGVVTFDVSLQLGRNIGGTGVVDRYVHETLADFPEDIDCDLPAGALGLGVYGLEHPDTRIGAQIVEATLAIVRDRAESDGDGLFHRLVDQPYRALADKTVGWRNLGLAHGNAGIIAFLARAAQRFPTDETFELLAGFVRWYCGQQRMARGGSVFSNHAETPYQGSRLAWCYGDLGAWIALESTRVADPGLEAVVGPALSRLATSGLTRPPTDLGLADASLCHGSSGVILIGRRMPATADSIVAQCLADLLAETAPFLYVTDDGLSTSSALLDGDVGVALALLDGESIGGRWLARLLL